MAVLGWLIYNEDTHILTLQDLFLECKASVVTFSLGNNISFGACFPQLYHKSYAEYTLKDLSQFHSIKPLLRNRQGIYGIYNNINNKQYIGSAYDLAKRIREHIVGDKTNEVLQRAIIKYGISNFSLVIYSFFPNGFNLSLTEFETLLINSFPFSMLYNIKQYATSMWGYRHTEEARAKMKLRLVDKTNHPMYGKSHTTETLALISKPGSLNPMYGKSHSAETRYKISEKLSKHPVGLFTISFQLVKTFRSRSDLAHYLGIHKTTVGRYLRDHKIYEGSYYFIEL